MRHTRIRLRSCPRCTTGAVLDDFDEYGNHTYTCVTCAYLHYPGHTLQDYTTPVRGARGREGVR